jgi:ribosome-associated toxin RatA of RatAB toxin-antitoxin module
MKTSNEIDVFGDPARLLPRVFTLAAEIERWPEILPHYRYMRILEATERRKVAEFGASRDGWPAAWTAVQELYPEEGRITFEHIGGVTKGMWVEWRLADLGDRVHVAIHHELTYPVPLLGDWFAANIVGRLFVENIAGKTLRCIKAIVEVKADAL